MVDTKDGGISDSKIEFYLPFLVLIEKRDVSVVECMLSCWKDEYLTGYTANLYAEFTRKHGKKTTVFRKILVWSKLGLKWFWPLLMLSLLANVLTGLSILFLAAFLLPVQLTMSGYMLGKMYAFICTASVFLLEKRQNEANNGNG